MNKLKTIFIAFFLMTTSFSFANWQSMELYQGDGSIEYVQYFFSFHNKEFLINDQYKGNGICLLASDSDLITAVSLKYESKNVDYVIDILSPLSEYDCTLWLNLLDENMFLIKKISVANIKSNFTGNLYGLFEINSKNFKKIKYYSLSAYVE